LWCVPVIPALWSLRQEDLEFKNSPGYTWGDPVSKIKKFK
jgi:hypothetical protein